MSRYFFHVVDDRSQPDLDGTELCSLDEARSQAIHSAASIITQKSPECLSKAPWRMIVADESGDTLYCLRFEAKDYR